MSCIFFRNFAQNGDRRERMKKGEQLFENPALGLSRLSYDEGVDGYELLDAKRNSYGGVARRPRRHKHDGVSPLPGPGQ